MVHGLDIAAAVPDLEPPGFTEQLLTQVALVAATAAVLRGRGIELIRALTGRAAQPGFHRGLTRRRVGLNWAAADPRRGSWEVAWPRRTI